MRADNFDPMSENQGQQGELQRNKAVECTGQSLDRL